MEEIPSFAQLDEQPMKAFHWRSIVTTGMGVFTDGYDLSAIGIVLPLVLTCFGVAHVSSIQGAMLAGSALIGAALGAVIFGLLGQRGRKTFYGLDVTIMAIAAVAQVFVPDLGWLIGGVAGPCAPGGGGWPGSGVAHRAGGRRGSGALGTVSAPQDARDGALSGASC